LQLSLFFLFARNIFGPPTPLLIEIMKFSTLFALGLASVALGSPIWEKRQDEGEGAKGAKGGKGGGGKGGKDAGPKIGGGGGGGGAGGCTVGFVFARGSAEPAPMV
jgi:hypothetical protein